MRARVLFALFLCVPAPEFINTNTLGRGVHASAQLKHATAKTFKRLATLIRQKVLVKGPQYKTRFTQHQKLHYCVAYLLGISAATVNRAIMFVKTHTANNSEKLPEPKQSGRKKLTIEQYRQKYGTVYDAILQYLRDAKKAGECVRVDALLDFLRREEPGKKGAIHLSYDALRYYLLRMGFRHGRICRRVSSNRYKEYIIAWLIAYCERRASYAKNPSETQKMEVYFLLDESFIFRNDNGDFSWFFPNDQYYWGKAQGGGQRWGIFHGLWTWWEPEGTTEIPDAPPRKRRKKDSPPDPQVEGYTRRFEIFNEVLHCWNCAGKDNMNNQKFMKCLEKVCDVFQKKFSPNYKLVIHMDNAAYHKNKNPEYLDLSKKNLTQHQIATWIVQHAPAEYGYDDIDTLMDENGEYFSIQQLTWIVNNLCPNEPQKIVNFIKSYDKDWRVEFTAPYWSHTMPMELAWNNLKLDYRGWDTKSKVARVNESVKKFFNAVTSRDVEGFIRHTDEFAFKVAARDEAFLKSYDIEL